MINSKVTIPATVVRRSVLTPEKESAVIRGVQVVVASALKKTLKKTLSITFYLIQPPGARGPRPTPGDL
jgi:hypothetical protein